MFIKNKIQKNKIQKNKVSKSNYSKKYIKIYLILASFSDNFFLNIKFCNFKSATKFKSLVICYYKRLNKKFLGKKLRKFCKNSLRSNRKCLNSIYIKFKHIKLKKFFLTRFSIFFNKKIKFKKLMVLRRIF